MATSRTSEYVAKTLPKIDQDMATIDKAWSDANGNDRMIAAGTVSTLTLDLYVSRDNLVRRITYQESIAPGLASSSSPTTSVLETQTLDLSDFGVPFTTSAPPPADIASG